MHAKYDLHLTRIVLVAEAFERRPQAGISSAVQWLDDE